MSLTVKPLYGGKYAVMSGHLEIERCDTRAQAIEVRAACPSDHIADFERFMVPLNPPASAEGYAKKVGSSENIITENEEGKRK